MEHTEDRDDDDIVLPKTLQDFRKRQKEIAERSKSETAKKNNTDFMDEDFGEIPDTKEKESSLTNSSKLKKIPHNKPSTSVNGIEEKSRVVNLIEESISISTNIITTLDSNIDIGEHFAKFLKRQNQLLDISASKLDLDFEDEKQQNLASSLGKAISEIISNTQDLKSDLLEKRFEVLCEQVLKHKDFWKGNENVAPMLSIRARVATFEASLMCWLAISEYPFVKNIEDSSLKMFTLVISLSRDIARNWQENLGSVERQQIYVSIVPLVAKIARHQWQIACMNKLSNEYATIDKMQTDLENEIINIFQPSKIGMQNSHSIARQISEKTMSMTDQYSEAYTHLKPSMLSRVKKTLLKQINFTTIQTANAFIGSNNLDSFNKNIDEELENFLEKIDSSIESNSPKIIVSIDGFHQVFKEGVVQMWGAAQGIYKFRS